MQRPLGTVRTRAAGRWPRHLARALFGLVLGLGFTVFGLADGASGDRPAAGPLPPPRPVLAPAVPSPAVGRHLLDRADPMSAVAFAHETGLALHRSHTFVSLSGPAVRLSLYPGTRDIVLAGERIRLKEAIRLEGGEAVLPAVVVQFLSRRVSESRRDLIADMHRRALEAAQRSPVPAAPQGARPRPAPPSPRAVAPAAPSRTPATGTSGIGTPDTVTPDRDWLVAGTERRWRWIVLHHSADKEGNAAEYDRVHRIDNGWEHGLGYHFVIGNGTLSGDGEVEVGPRWPRQLHGAHARNHDLGDNRYNEEGIGICLVGDFHDGGQAPSQRQMDELVRLTRWLMGRYQIGADMVLRHCDCCVTDCPGRHFPWAQFLARLEAAEEARESRLAAR